MAREPLPLLIHNGTGNGLSTSNSVSDRHRHLMVLGFNVTIPYICVISGLGRLITMLHASSPLSIQPSLVQDQDTTQNRIYRILFTGIIGAVVPLATRRCT